MLIMIIVIFRLRMITDHVVHGKKQTEDPGKHPWRQELLPEGRRLQPEDEHGDEESGDKKIKMAKMTMVKVAIVRPEDNYIKDEDDNESDKNLKYQLHDDCQTVLT